MKEGYKKTDIGVIPEDWDVKKLEVVIDEFIVPMRDKPKVFDGEIDWCRIEDIEGKYIHRSRDRKKVSDKIIYEMNLNVFPQRSLICSCSASLGVYAINTKPLITNQIFIGLVTSRAISVDYLYYYMYVATERLKKISPGTTIPYISRDKFEKFKVVLPPLKEQERIAEILSTVDCQIDDTDKLIEKCTVLKKGLMQRLLTKGIGHSEFKKTEVGEISVGWEVKKLDEISSITRLAGAEYSDLWNPIEDGEIIALRGFNIGSNKLILDNVERISNELSSRLNRSKLYRNDIVFHCVGTIGKAAVIYEDDKYHINRNIAKITPNEDMYSLYLSYYLISEYVRTQIFKYNTSSSQPNVLVGNLRKFSILVPPKFEQEKIAKIVSSVDNEIEKYESKKVKLEELKKGLMQQLLTGKTRII